MEPYEHLIQTAKHRALKALREKEDAKRLRAAKKHAAQAIAKNRERSPDGS